MKYDKDELAALVKEAVTDALRDLGREAILEAVAYGAEAAFREVDSWYTQRAIQDGAEAAFREVDGWYTERALQIGAEAAFKAVGTESILDAIADGSREAIALRKN